MKIKTLLFTGILVLLLTMPVYGGGWDTSLIKDESTGEQLAIAHSSVTKPTNNIGFPYSDTKAWFAVACNGIDEHIAIGFNIDPDLRRVGTKNGYAIIKAKIKWDNKVKDVLFLHKRGSHILLFHNASEAEYLLLTLYIARSNSALLELDWHGEGKVYFDFSLKGSSAALEKICKECFNFQK